MPLSAFQQAVRSNPATDFTEALIANEASATVNLKLPSKNPLWFIRAISIIATQDLQYEVQLFGKAVNMGPTLETDWFIAAWQYYTLVVGPPASPGWPIDTVDMSPDNGFYHFYIDGNMMPYYDMDQLTLRNPSYNVPLGDGVTNANVPNASLHVRLINRSAAAKNADTAGALLVTFFVAPQGQQV